MRIENIAAQLVSPEQAGIQTGMLAGFPVENTSSKEDETKILKSVQAGNAGYNKSDFQGASSQEDIALALQKEINQENVKDEMIALGDQLDSDSKDEVEKLGFSLEAVEARQINTVTDKIMMQLAMAGVDISAFGADLSDIQINSIAGNNQAAAAVRQALELASEEGSIGDSGLEYLLKNNMEPTIDNFYKAKYSGGVSNEIIGVNDTEYEKLKAEIGRILAKAGQEVNETTLGDGKWLLERGIEITPENLTMKIQMDNGEIFQSEKEIIDSVVRSISEGKDPAAAYMLPGYSAIERAQSVEEVLESANENVVATVLENGESLTIQNLKTAEKNMSQDTNDGQRKQEWPELVTAMRKLEEARLTMTIQANYSLIKRGITIETAPIEEVVEALKAKEKSAYDSMLGVDGEAASVESIEVFEKTVQVVSDIKQIPAATLGLTDLHINTAEEIRNLGWNLKDRFDRANQTYDVMGTSPRYDMGDSIKKAFANVDHILEDLNIKVTPENERAVRILGYNSMDITVETVTSVRSADEEMQRAFKALTPAVVAQMVKDGINPLDMSMSELTKTAEGIRDTYGLIGSEEERFSKFLVKLEDNKQISQEERDAYMGIYRLIARVERGDDAALGSLIDQGREVTMRNLMMAARTSKKIGSDVRVDDKFGALSEVKRSEMTITEQIDTNLVISQLKLAAQSISPESLHKISEKADLLDLTPEELLSGLELTQSLEEVKEETERYNDSVIEEYSNSVASEDEIYSILQHLEMPTTAESINVVSYILQNRGQMMKNLLSDEEREEKPDIQALKDKVWEKLGEDVKTPQQLAEAQEALAEAAEHAMDGVIVEEEVRAVDVKGMKLVKTAAMAMKSMAQKQQTYHLPIMIGDEMGDVSLKIVSGEKKTGLIDLLFSFEKTGDVSAHLEWKEDGIRGEISARELAVGSAINEALDSFVDELIASQGVNVDISASDQTMRASQIYLDEPSSADATVQTEDLFKVANSLLKFIKGIAEAV